MYFFKFQTSCIVATRDQDFKILTPNQFQGVIVSIRIITQLRTFLVSLVGVLH